MKPVDLLRQYAGALEHDPSGPNTGIGIHNDLEFIAERIDIRQDLAPHTRRYRYVLDLCYHGNPLWRRHCRSCKDEGHSYDRPPHSTRPRPRSHDCGGHEMNPTDITISRLYLARQMTSSLARYIELLHAEDEICLADYARIERTLEETKTVLHNAEIRLQRTES